MDPVSVMLYLTRLTGLYSQRVRHRVSTMYGRRANRGQALPEYALIIVLVAFVAMPVLADLGEGIRLALNELIGIASGT